MTDPNPWIDGLWDPGLFIASVGAGVVTVAVIALVVERRSLWDTLLRKLHLRGVS